MKESFVNLNHNMKYLPYYIPFFGMIITLIEDDDQFFKNNPHLLGTAIVHGIIWGAIFAG